VQFVYLGGGGRFPRKVNRPSHTLQSGICEGGTTLAFGERGASTCFLFDGNGAVGFDGEGRLTFRLFGGGGAGGDDCAKGGEIGLFGSGRPGGGGLFWRRRKGPFGILGEEAGRCGGRGTALRGGDNFPSRGGSFGGGAGGVRAWVPLAGDLFRLGRRGGILGRLGGKRGGRGGADIT